MPSTGHATAPAPPDLEECGGPSVLADTEPSTSHLVRWDEYHTSPTRQEPVIMTLRASVS
jgi:hypothetical protein